MFPDSDDTTISDEGEPVAPPALEADAGAPSSQIEHLAPIPRSPAESAGEAAAASGSEVAAALGPVVMSSLASLPAIPTPLPPPPTPKPKPPIRPERVLGASGDTSWRTDAILVERAAPRAFFITISPAQRPPQRIYVHDQAFDQLLHLATAPSWDTGRLWRALCDIPLERPLPNRRL